MACVVIERRIWNEEVGGRPHNTDIDIVDELLTDIDKKDKNSSYTSSTRDDNECFTLTSTRRHRKRSPFRPWTPESKNNSRHAHSHLDDEDSSRETACTQQRRNYKNMTRERRIEANARERTRVHTISAAYDNLRRAVPAYSHNQKLSKLAVLKVATSYILTLSRIIDKDYSLDQSEPSLESCVDSITATIQMEGRLKKRKED